MQKIAYVQLKISIGNPNTNFKKILNFISQAREQYADVIIFPELSISGKITNSVWQQETFLEDCISYGEEIIAASENIFVIFGNVTRERKSFYFIANKGKLIDKKPISKFVAINFNGTNLYLNFESEPIDIHKNIRDEIIPLNYPLIRVSSIGIQNIGKAIYIYRGNSSVFNSRGEMIQAAQPFEECLKIIELDKIENMPAIKIRPESEPEKIYQALSYGIKNFLEQIGKKKVVIGVSGGIDSAVAAALYKKILGNENLLLVNMPSIFNSQTTQKLSRQLAQSLNCKFCVIPIQPSVDSTIQQLESTSIEFLGNNSIERVKISEFVCENIQARDRSSRILAALAAATDGVFTCNANKTELTIGYTTLYGDATGFLAALADLWKFQIYTLANFLNEEIYHQEVIPQEIIELVPSAELSSSQAVDQKKGDPLIYPYHDYLFRAFVENDMTPEDILNLYRDEKLEDKIGCVNGIVEKHFQTDKDFINDLERWWKYFNGIGIAKRLQTPPIIAVTNKSFGARLEVQNICYFTERYKRLREQCLKKHCNL